MSLIFIFIYFLHFFTHIHLSQYFTRLYNVISTWRRLPITSQRLGAGGGFHCGLDESGSGCSTQSVGRDTPPLAPNRPLCDGFFYCYFIVFTTQ